MTNKYYQKHKEKLQKEARERYQNISEKEKKSIIIFWWRKLKSTTIACIKKNVKIFFLYFFSFKCQINIKYQISNTKKTFEKNDVKDIKIFMKKKKKKKCQYHRERNKNLSEGETKKKFEYMKNYLAHQSYLYSWFVDLWVLG